MTNREISPGSTLYRDEEKLLFFLPKEETKILKEFINERHKLKIALGQYSRFSETSNDFFSRITPEKTSEEIAAHRAKLLTPDPELQAMFLEAFNNTVKMKKESNLSPPAKPSHEELQALLEFCLKEIKQEIEELKAQL